MAKSIIFHPTDRIMMEVDDSEIQRHAERGYKEVFPGDLAAIYSPTLDQHETILRSDSDVWERRGYIIEPTYVYHPSGETKIVGREQAKLMLQDEWFDSPAKFPNQPSTEQLVEAAVKATKAKKE